eukprot:SAG11_NODE_17764_length_509_cov_1.500000_1_plen_44_part_10
MHVQYMYSQEAKLRSTREPPLTVVPGYWVIRNSKKKIGRASFFQ